MSGFIVFQKLTQKEAIETIRDIEKWFNANPKKKQCKTDLFVVRRGHIAEDVLKHSENISV